MGRLVLSRQKDQLVHVDGPCVIQIREIYGSRVLLRLIANENVKILRGELVDEQAGTSEQQIGNALADDVSRQTL